MSVWTRDTRSALEIQVSGIFEPHLGSGRDKHTKTGQHSARGLKPVQKGQSHPAGSNESSPDWPQTLIQKEFFRFIRETVSKEQLLKKSLNIFLDRNRL